MTSLVAPKKLDHTDVTSDSQSELYLPMAVIYNLECLPPISHLFITAKRCIDPSIVVPS